MGMITFNDCTTSLRHAVKCVDRYIMTAAFFVVSPFLSSSQFVAPVLLFQAGGSPARVCTSFRSSFDTPPYPGLLFVVFPATTTSSSGRVWLSLMDGVWRRAYSHSFRSSK